MVKSQQVQEKDLINQYEDVLNMVKLEVEKVEGEGSPLVFIHGWLGSKESWNQVRDRLDLENPMIFYSQRCHGNSETKKFDIEDLANDLKKITEELEKPILIGHSLGGMTALKYSTMSDNYSGLILFGTCASTPEPKHESVKYFLNKLGEIPKRKWSEMITDNYAENADQELRDQSIKELQESDKKPLKTGLQAMINYDVSQNIETENGLAVAGTGDNAIRTKQVKELSDSLNCDYQEINSTHLMLQEKPREVAEIIEEFVYKNY